MVNWILLLRPRQWVKNVFVLAGLIFGGELSNISSVLRSFSGFVCFCVLASGIYIINDIRDRDEDRNHPTKRSRPIASGAISPASAAVASLLLICIGIFGSIVIDLQRQINGPFTSEYLFTCWSVAYVLLNLAYTFILKYVMLVDVIIIASGFVIRALAGAAAVSTNVKEVEISPWLVICTFMLCLFMGFGKRRCEVAQLGNQVTSHRAVGKDYSLSLLDHILSVTAGISVVSYLLYTMSPRTSEVFTAEVAERLAYTTPLVLYGIFRFYAQVAGGRVEGPTEIVTRDRPFQIGVTLWGIAVVLIIYLR